MRLFVLARHAESTLNQQNRINGDPLLPAGLTDSGRTQAQLLGQELSALPIELCVHTRFGRTRATSELALEGRAVPMLEEPLLDDVDVGELEGQTVEEYHAWKRAHPARSKPFPGGESLDDAARRYAGGFRGLLERSEQVILVVAHEIPIRYALNAAAQSRDLDAPVHAIPNARPYLFDDANLERAVVRIEASARLS